MTSMAASMVSAAKRACSPVCSKKVKSAVASSVVMTVDQGGGVALCVGPKVHMVWAGEGVDLGWRGDRGGGERGLWFGGLGKGERGRGGGGFTGCTERNAQPLISLVLRATPRRLLRPSMKLAKLSYIGYCERKATSVSQSKYYAVPITYILSHGRLSSHLPPIPQGARCRFESGSTHISMLIRCKQVPPPRVSDEILQGISRILYFAAPG